MGSLVNVEFQYLYRDAGNFKNFGSVIFGNRSGASIASVEEAIRSKTFENLFDAASLQLPELFFKEFPYDPELDHPLHEFAGLVATDGKVNDACSRDIADIPSQIGRITWDDPFGPPTPSARSSKHTVRVPHP